MRRRNLDPVVVITSIGIFRVVEIGGSQNLKLWYVQGFNAKKALKFRDVDLFSHVLVPPSVGIF